MFTFSIVVELFRNNFISRSDKPDFLIHPIKSNIIQQRKQILWPKLASANTILSNLQLLLRLQETFHIFQSKIITRSWIRKHLLVY